MNDIKAFWREHNFDLREECVRKEYDSDDDSQTLQPTKATRQEFRNRIRRYRNWSLSPHNKRSRYDSPDRRSESKERSGSRSLSRSRDYQGPRETTIDVDRNQNGFYTRNESEAEAEAEEHTGNGSIILKEGERTIRIEINQIKEDIEKHRRKGWCDNPNDDWTKRTQIQNDIIENHSDRDSTWTEDDVPQLLVATPQSKLHARQTQRIQQIQVQPKQQASAPVPKKKGRIDQPPNHDDIEEQEILQERLATLQKKKEQYNISDQKNEQRQVIGEIDNNDYLTPKQAQKQLQEMIQQSIFSETAKQQQQTTISKVQQRIVSPLPRMINTGMNKDIPENNDLNITNIETPDIQGTVGQLTDLQPSSGSQNPGLNAGPRLMQAGSISASIKERIKPQINQGQKDDAEEEEDEQIDEAALNQNKDYRVNIILQPQVQENLGTQPQNNQDLNTLSYKEKDNPGPAPAGVQKKPNKGRGSKKSKSEGLNASDEQSQGSNAQAQIKSTFKVEIQ
ncbi:MAG: hypothetical protein EZS28_007156 [Streblomastix strix]|uniref:Uncharacterized protein n=1 Tax=Streblomastix strix TaxID=222440 RepID=A0A5J4WS06_9EUKA|nr:MAG: hypothetical protein EZS28_007156 [Streblomastix strix]